ncbi:MAG: SDR family NAD(P)-dependent oxidoreductase [Solirubrobacterales bacterium]|nr:SDR family NAD(P)-dependent oxidoreductase [Solirubrobacterales bacterium]
MSRVQLSSAHALVTGATGGIGHAIARHLHRAGARLTLTGRRTDVLEPLCAETGARSLVVDLADRDAVLRLADECSDADVLIANAALPASGDVRSFSVEELDAALDVNLRAPMVLARLIGERMAERGRGHIVFVSSLSGKSGQRGSAVYSATKFGLRGFGQGLRGDLRDDGVGVSVVFPGFIREAGMFHDSGAKLPKGVGTSTPDDVAAGVLKAIEQDRAELDVAPLGLRAGTAVAGLAPEVSAKIARRLGGDRIAEDMGAGQAAKRR